MSFKFTEIEGIDAELAEKLDADESIAKAIEAHTSSQIEDGVTNRVEVARSEFKKKMDGLDAKLKDAESRLEDAPDIGKDELKALREARDKNPELVATLSAMQKRTEDAEAALNKQTDLVMEMQLGSTIQQAINDYDTAHPTVAVKSDMKDLVSMLAKDSLKFDEEAKKFRVYNKAGEIVATDKGAATPVDWLGMLRTERPSLFSAPAGSGATGSKPPNGSAKKYADMTEKEKVDLYHSDRDTFNQIKGAATNGNSSTI